MPNVFGTRLVSEDGTSTSHLHALPDVDIGTGVHTYADGCCVIKYRDGRSVFVPADDPAVAINPDSDPAT